MPITLSEDFSSCNSNGKLFIPNSQLNINTLPDFLKFGGACYDGCSSVVECTVVVRETRVRFSASILSQRFFNDDLLRIIW